MCFFFLFIIEGSKLTKDKYITEKLETKRLNIDKGTSEACIKVYEYDMLKCREIAGEDILELSFNMHPDYWRCGYMKEAVTVIINYLFSIVYSNIIMGYDDGNIKSKSFIENMGGKFYKRIENTYVKNNINISSNLMIISKDEWNKKIDKKAHVKL